MTDDRELLDRFFEARRAGDIQQADHAFRELVVLHGGLVHGVAVRIMNNEDLARDVSQQVFCKLAQSPDHIFRELPLGVWLHRVARSCAIDLVRSEETRHRREQSFSMNEAITRSDESDWSAIKPVIDESIDELRKHNRTVIVMRYYQMCSHSEIGAALKISPEAARKRLGRALELLQDKLARRGIATSAAALATIIPTHAFIALPPTLIATISSSAVSQCISGTTVRTVTIVTLMNKKAITATLAILLLAGMGTAFYTMNRKGASPSPAETPQTIGIDRNRLSAADDSQRARQQAAEKRRLAATYGEEATLRAEKIFRNLVLLQTNGLEISRALIETGFVKNLIAREESLPSLLEIMLGETPDLSPADLTKIAKAFDESMERIHVKDLEDLFLLKKDPLKGMEMILAGDALNQGRIGQAEYDEMRQRMSLPPGILDIKGDENLGTWDVTSDPIFLEELEHYLNESEKVELQKRMEIRRVETEKMRNEKQALSLREYESQLNDALKEVLETRESIDLLEAGKLDGK